MVGARLKPIVVGNPCAMAEGMLTIVIGRICKHYESKKDAPLI
jgi:hypothetical protein